MAILCISEILCILVILSILVISHILSILVKFAILQILLILYLKKIAVFKNLEIGEFGPIRPQILIRGGRDMTVLEKMAVVARFGGEINLKITKGVLISSNYQPSNVRGYYHKKCTPKKRILYRYLSNFS